MPPDTDTPTSQPEELRCRDCGAGICGRQAVISRVLAGKNGSRCLACLSGSLGSSPEQLCELVGNYLVRRDCYRQDWLNAAPCACDGQAACCPSRLEHSDRPPAWYSPELFTPAAADLPAPDLSVDAEEAGCGDLMVLLMRSIRKLEPGQVLALTARDPGAAADIPSWCRLTGHPLLAGPTGPEAATYHIQRKPT